MKNVVDFPDTAAIDEEAAGWLVRMDAEEPLSDVERSRLREWLHRSPAHRERLSELAQLWGKLNALTELAVPLAPSAPSKGAAARRWGPPLGGAVVACAALSAFLFVSFAPSSIEASNGLYSSAIGEQRSTALVDGSEIILNTNSQIHVDYDDSHRDVRLIQGEALFIVAEDEHRRFRVFAGGGRIDAVGTAFSVYLKDDGVDITVTEGTVSLSSVKPAPASGPAPTGSRALNASAPAQTEIGMLRAGQVATLPRFDEPGSEAVSTQLRDSRIVQEQELRRRLSWTNGNLTFSDEPLEHVVNEISRYTTVKIEFADPELKAMPMGGFFPVGETALMFEALEAYNLKVTYLSANRVRISAAE